MFFCELLYERYILSVRVMTIRAYIVNGLRPSRKWGLDIRTGWGRDGLATERDSISLGSATGMIEVAAGAKFHVASTF